MGKRAVLSGPVGPVTAEMVRAVRKRRGMTQGDLSARLGNIGRPMAPSAVAKMESGERRVDVDDLVALALALDVQPARLLLPDRADEEVIELAPNVSTRAWAAWQWAQGLNALPSEAEMAGEDSDDEQLRSASARDWTYQQDVPAELHRIAEHPATRAAVALLYRVRRLAHHSAKGGEPSRGLELTLGLARQQLDQLRGELDIIDKEARNGQH